MSLTLLHTLLFLIIGPASITVATDCDFLSCDGLNPGDNLADPYNCNRYYVCLSNCEISDVPLECDGDLVFDNETMKCVAPDGTNCNVCPPKCIFSCDGMGDVFLSADPQYCTKYYVCGLGPDPIKVDCPTGQYFDGEVCQTDKSKCCDKCIVYCMFEFTEIADPTDCHNFYYCPKGQYYPTEKDLKTCPDGKIFSSKQGKCADSQPCLKPCSGSREETKPLKPSFAPCVVTTPAVPSL